jgi:predicted nucleic acid-binding protein
VILDTSFLIDLMNSKRTAVEKADAIERRVSSSGSRR